LSLRQLIGVAYHAVCEAIGQEKADETLAAMAEEYEPTAKPRRPRLTAAEKEARSVLLGAFGPAGG
jgi:hypothetical protein